MAICLEPEKCILLIVNVPFWLPWSLVFYSRRSGVLDERSRDNTTKHPKSQDSGYSPAKKARFRAVIDMPCSVKLKAGTDYPSDLNGMNSRRFNEQSYS
jgi:hypothetical protein